MGVHQVKIRIVKAFNGYRVGQVFDWGDGMARVFIARGLIEEVKPDLSVERAVVDKQVERAVVKPQVKRRGK